MPLTDWMMVAHPSLGLSMKMLPGTVLEGVVREDHTPLL
jgi:hypothetical protein